MKDIYRHQEKYERLLQEIQGLKPENRRALNRYRRHLISQNLTTCRIIKLLREIKLLMQKTSLSNPTKLKTYRILEKINDMPVKYNTRRDYKIALKSYYKSLGYKKEDPVIAIITVGNPEIRIPKRIVHDPGIWKNMVTFDEKLFVRMKQEAGTRPSELLTLKWDYVEYTDFGAIITVKGKTGTRAIPLIDSAKMLAEKHKQAEKHEPYVFPFSYDFIARKIKKMLKAQGYPDTYMYVFRKSRASYLYENIPGQLVKKHMGWTKDSRMGQTYDFSRHKSMINAVVELAHRGPLLQHHHKITHLCAS